MLDFRDPATFRAFIATHQDRVFNMVLKVVQDVHDAEEITQDVFVDVYRKPEAFRGEAAITTWLYRIAMNKCIDQQRRVIRKRSKFLSFFFQPAQTETNEPVDFMHPGAVAESREKTRLLFKALLQLPVNQKMAWVLAELEDLDYKDISTAMNMSVPAIESLLLQERKNLKKILAGLYPG